MMCWHPAGSLAALPSSQHMAELAFQEELFYKRTIPALPGWHGRQTGVGLDSGVHAHVGGMSKGTGCTSEEWSPKGEIRKRGFSSATSRDGACAAGGMGGTEDTLNPPGRVASVKGGGRREMSPSSNCCLCGLLMAEHWEKTSGRGPVLLLLHG